MMSSKRQSLLSRVTQEQVLAPADNMQVQTTMRYTSSFIARVKDQSNDGDSAKEHMKIVSLKKSNLAAYIVLRRAPRAGVDSDPRKSSAAVSEYPVSRCIKVTPWNQVQRQSSIAIQFEKSEDNLQKLNTKRVVTKPSQIGRTKVNVITIREWSQESADIVRDVWNVLNDAAEEAKLRNPALSNESDTNHTSGAPDGVVDHMFRLKERTRFSDLNNASLSTAKPTRTLSQGKRGLQAISRGTQQKRGRYSALTRGAVGAATFSSSLIGPPPGLRNLGGPSDQGSPPALSRTDRLIKKEFGRRAAKSIKKSTPPLHDSPNSGSTKKSSLSSRQQSVFESLSREGRDSAVQSPHVSPQRQHDSKRSPGALERRKKFAAASILAHKNGSRTSSQLQTQHQESPPDIKSLRDGSEKRLSRSGLGILNEGNTCYLSSVIQALMSDADLLSRIEESIIPQFDPTPFSSALIEMAKGRGSLGALNAGDIRKAISEHFEEFASDNQQDAHEFFLRSLDVISNECYVKELWDSPTHTNYSLVQQRKFACTSCAFSPEPRLEILRGLSLDIPSYEDQDLDSTSLQDLVSQYFQPQQLELNCERCDNKQAKSETKVVLAPRSLVLHLNRCAVVFDSSDKSTSFKKISDTVMIPETVSLESVLAHNAISYEYLRDDQPMAKAESDSVKEGTPALVGEQDMIREAPKTSENEGPSVSLEIKSSPIDKSSEKRPRGAVPPHDFARRVRVNADKGLSQSVPTSPVTQNIGNIMAVGISQLDAEACWRESHCNMGKALELAVNRLEKLRQSRPDLDAALVSSVRKASTKSVSSQYVHPRYKLMAVIRHDSDSVQEGHYVADVRQSDGTWFCYNDSLVSELDSRSAQNTEGYLCWYTQEDIGAKVETIVY